MALDFPSSPTIGQVANGFTWDGEKWNAIPAEVPKKNYIVNGAMMVSQEFGSVGVSSGAFPNAYPVDMFYFYDGTAGTIGGRQTAEMSPSGSPNRLRITVSASAASIAAGDFMQLATIIEDLRVADLMMGRPQAKTVTIRFGVRAVAGTYGIAIRNYPAYNRAYVSEFTISAAEALTDVVRTVTIPLDQTGTWTHLQIMWGLAAGTNFQAAKHVWWGGGAPFATPAISNTFMAAVNNIFELFDVGFYIGTVAPTYELPEFAQEYASCQRYYEKSYDHYILPGTPTSTSVRGWHDWTVPTAATGGYLMCVDFKVRKRTTPTVTLYDNVGTPGTVYKGGSGQPAYLQGAGENGFVGGMAGAGPASNEMGLHFVAQARP